MNAIDVRDPGLGVGGGAGRVQLDREHHRVSRNRFFNFNHAASDR